MKLIASAKTISIALLLGLSSSIQSVLADAPETEAPFEPNGWSLYFPVHMPGLELTQPVEGGPDVEVDASMVDLAKHANSFYALGFGYEWRAWDHSMWFDMTGWHGGYDMDMDDMDVDVPLPPVIGDQLDVNVDMKQRIVQAEVGMLVVEDWHRLDLGLTTGIRYYDQIIKVFGTIPIFNTGCGLIGCFEAQPFREKEETTWTEFTFGLMGNYHWHDRNVVTASISWGDDESIRMELLNTLTFKQSWFTSLGWRRDEFVNDGVEIIESGLYVDIGKRF